MAEYILNRNHILRSLSGHSIAFEKGIPTFVPNACIREVEAIGGERVDGENGQGLEEKPKVEVPTGDERNQLVFEAFAEIINKNAREDFTAQGAPHIKAVKALVGFAIDNKERDTLWAEYREKQGSAE